MAGRASEAAYYWTVGHLCFSLSQPIRKSDLLWVIAQADAPYGLCAVVHGPVRPKLPPDATLREDGQTYSSSRVLCH